MKFYTKIEYLPLYKYQDRANIYWYMPFVFAFLAKSFKQFPIFLCIIPLKQKVNQKMKSRIGLIAAICIMFTMLSCNNHQKEVDQLKEKVKEDSLALHQAQGKDTIIASYVNTLGEIQDNLDSLKYKEKILSMNPLETSPDKKKKILQDIKTIDDALIFDNQKIKTLEARLHKMQNKDAGLNKTIARLTQEISEKNEEIANLNSKLGKADDSLVILSQRFNDTISEINRQRAKYGALTNAYNAVYYVTGTMKELKDKKAITKTGGLLGIGRTSEINANSDNSAFIKSDMTQLSSIPLKGKFSKLATTHPASSYKIDTEGKSYTFVITNPASFWSESKYLVIITK